MKFLLDAQLPVSLKQVFKEAGYECLHTLDLPEKNFTTDEDILKFVSNEKCVLVTKDNDFLVSHIIRNKPLKLLYVKTGNIKNTDLKNLLTVHIVKISELLAENNLLQLTQIGIIIQNI